MFFLTHLLNGLCFVGGVQSGSLVPHYHHRLVASTVPFLVLFLTFIVHALLTSNFTMGPRAGRICVRPCGCFVGLVSVPLLLMLFLSNIIKML